MTRVRRMLFRLLPLFVALATIAAGCSSTTEIAGVEQPAAETATAEPSEVADSGIETTTPEIAEVEQAAPEAAVSEQGEIADADACDRNLYVSEWPTQPLDDAAAHDGFWFLDEFGLIMPFIEEAADKMWVLDTDAGFAGPTLFVLAGFDVPEMGFGESEPLVGDWVVVGEHGGDLLRTTVLVQDETVIRVTGVHLDTGDFDRHIEQVPALVEGSRSAIGDMVVRRSGDPADTDYSIDVNQGRRTDDAMSVSWLCDRNTAEGELLPFDPLLAFWLALPMMGPSSVEPFEHQGLPGILTTGHPETSEPTPVAYVMGNGMMLMLEDDSATKDEDAGDFAAKLSERYKLRSD